jgi:hypothetical protein
MVASAFDAQVHRLCCKMWAAVSLSDAGLWQGIYWGPGPHLGLRRDTRLQYTCITFTLKSWSGIDAMPLHNNAGHALVACMRVLATDRDWNIASSLVS